MKRVVLATALLWLSHCSSPPQTVPEDPVLARLGHAGHIAFDLEQPEQAAEQYRAALARARTRDDGAAIADAGFNLATAELRASHPENAMRTAGDLQAELARRGIADPGFDLISATALFRLNNLAAADQMAAGLTGGKDPALANAAWFLRGLIADARNDRAQMQNALVAMTPAADPADIAELQSRLTHDKTLALHAADLRRNRLDYRGMARALALSAQLAQDPPEQADLYLRAGRSAAAQGDAADARIWFSKARDLTMDTALRTDAEQGLHDLPAQ